MDTESDLLSTSDENDYSQYRALSMWAVAALILGVASLPSLLFAKMLFVPLVGLAMAVYALRTVNRHEDQLTGIGLARTGLMLCLVSFLGGVIVTTTIYATEVPEGYKRISFAELQPDPRRPRQPFPPEVLQLDGQRVFVKGYVYPGDRTSELKQFILVPDMGTCCFGGQPALTDMIEVTLRDPKRIRFSYQRRKLGGIFKVNPELKEINGLTGVYFQLDADYVR